MNASHLRRWGTTYFLEDVACLASPARRCLFAMMMLAVMRGDRRGYGGVWIGLLAAVGCLVLITSAAEAQATTIRVGHLIHEELAAETRTPLPAELVERAWKRIIVTSDISQQILDKFMSNAQSVGFLRGAPDLSRLVEKP